MTAYKGTTTKENLLLISAHLLSSWPTLSLPIVSSFVLIDLGRRPIFL